ncbi:MAG TPA: phosphodiester glycosidase family protein [Patescibacteria group bacterium]
MKKISFSITVAVIVLGVVLLIYRPKILSKTDFVVDPREEKRLKSTQTEYIIDQAPPTAEPTSISVATVKDPNPTGFTPYTKQTGLSIYQGHGSYLLIADLTKTGIELLYGNLTGKTIPGIFEGPDAFLKSAPLESYLSKADHRDLSVACAFNGSFFKMVDYPTHLAHPLKVDGNIITYGWETDSIAHPGEKLMLQIWPGTADIKPLTDKLSFEGASAPDILTGLTVEANKEPKRVTGRTFVGIKNNYLLYVLVVENATQKNAADILRSLGVDKMMMLDGGTSSQLTCKTEGKMVPLIKSDRPIPQAVYIYSK